MARPGPVPFRPDEATPLLPLGLIWVFAIAPVGLTVVMEGNLAAISAEQFWWHAAANYVPFASYGAACFLVYSLWMPAVLTRVPSVRGRVVAHVLTVIVVVVPLAYPVGQLHRWVVGAVPYELDYRSYALVSVVVASSCVLPALTVQHLRLRAHAAERAYQAERRAAVQAQLDALQARTDPHFLFNSLNTVAALIPEDPARAERAVEQLADLFRYALEAGRTRAVPLGRELQMISEYLALQDARFGDRLRTRLEVEPGLSEVPVPPLLLQPLVENAIKHGAESRHGGEVVLRVRREGQSLVIEVLDDGPGPGGSQHSGSGSAVAGIAERLRLHYAGRGDFLLEPRVGQDGRGGSLARVRVPLSEVAEAPA